MDIINLPRAGGKTLQAVKLSAEYNIPILCVDNLFAIHDRAKELNLQIPRPITVNELLAATHTQQLPSQIIIDELEIVLQQILEKTTGKQIKIKAATLSDNANSKKIRHYTYIDEDITD